MYSIGTPVVVAICVLPLLLIPRFRREGASWATIAVLCMLLLLNLVFYFDHRLPFARG
jgi:sterol desaturase/sphingolipid hydroxylase (fatty acid hydroxylase superfamily)